MPSLEKNLGWFFRITTPGWAFNPTMQAIRNGFLLSLPLVVVGSIALLINNLPVPAYQHEMELIFGPNWHAFGATIWEGTFGILSLPMLFGISQHLVIIHNQRNPMDPVNPIIAALVSLGTLVVFLPVENDDWMPSRWLGSSGLFISILTALAVTNVFLRLMKIRSLRLTIYAEGGDSTIPQAFSCLIPGILTILIFTTLLTFYKLFVGENPYYSIHDLVLYPFSLFKDSLGTSTAYVFISQLFWFFGVHGSNVLDPVTHQFYETAFQENLLASAQHLPLPHTITKPMLDMFVYMGGSGSTICLLCALLIGSKNHGSKRLAYLSVLPATFNINEIILFGLPVILNPIFLIPFILVPLVLMFSTYLTIHFGLMPNLIVPIDWTTPPIIGGYVATGGSISGSLVQCFNIVLGTLIYYPFVRVSDQVKQERQKKAMSGLMDVACNNAVGPTGKKCLDRDDEIGALARALANDLQLALTRNEGLYLEYQPQIDYDTGKVIGAEALVRWRHPSYGPIPPPIMVAISEDGDFIKTLGLWVLDNACAERKRWQQAGIEDKFKLSVNVSTLQLQDQNLAQKFAAALQLHGLSPSTIGVEITESVALDPDAQHNQILHQINDHGISISIDDFGMGHSSLLYLKQFPVSTLKIDKALSKDVVNNRTCYEIISTIVDLCRALKVGIVVEFVENQEQIDILKKLGCHVYQGYFFSKPLSGEALLAYTQKKNATDTEHESTV